MPCDTLKQSETRSLSRRIVAVSRASRSWFLRHIIKILTSPVEQLSQGKAKVQMTTTDIMAADARGLTHGGFYFGNVTGINKQ